MRVVIVVNVVATISGWLATACIALSAAIPLLYRFRNGKRAAPSSSWIRTHVAFGLATSAMGFGHTIMIVPDLGSPGAVAGGALALAPGALAFFVLMAHTGIGLQLRQEKLKERAAKRRTHGITATVIAVAVAFHVIALHR